MISKETVEDIDFSSIDILCELLGKDVRSNSDYLFKSKAFEILKDLNKRGLLERQERIQVSTALQGVLRQEKEEEFKLRAIDVMQYIEEQEIIDALNEVLEDRNPYLVRAAFIALGQIGGEKAVCYLLKFTASPQGRLIRWEIMEEALAFALKKLASLEQAPDPAQLLADLARGDANIRRILPGFNFKVPPIANYSVFPCNDYFALAVKKRGLNYKEYRLFLGER